MQANNMMNKAEVVYVHPNFNQKISEIFYDCYSEECIGESQIKPLPSYLENLSKDDTDDENDHTKKEIAKIESKTGSDPNRNKLEMLKNFFEVLQTVSTMTSNLVKAYDENVTSSHLDRLQNAWSTLKLKQNRRREPMLIQSITSPNIEESQQRNNDHLSQSHNTCSILKVLQTKRERPMQIKPKRSPIKRKKRCTRTFSSSSSFSLLNMARKNMVFPKGQNMLNPFNNFNNLAKNSSSIILHPISVMVPVKMQGEEVKDQKKKKNILKSSF